MAGCRYSRRTLRARRRGLARGLVAARVLRFGFTPHNAEPVTMQFAVAGWPLLARAAKEGCKAAVQ